MTSIPPETPQSILTSLPFDQNPVVIYLNGLTSPASQRVMYDALNVIAQLLTQGQHHALSIAWHELHYEHVIAIRRRLIEHYKPASVNRMLSALRGTLKTAWRLGQIDSDVYQRLSDVSNVKVDTLPAGRELAMSEIIALIDVCHTDTSPAGVRDLAILGLLYTCGLRRAEIVAIQCNDVSLDTSAIKILSGKGRKQRMVYAQGGALKALYAWLTIHPYPTGLLFIPIRKNGSFVQRGISAQAIYNIVKKRGKEANLNDFSPHDLRRTFVSDLLERGADIATVAKLAGHDNIQTTARYDRRPEESKKQASKLLNYPVE